MSKPPPLSFLIDNRDAVVAVYSQSERKPKKTWSSLKQTLPELVQAMSFNTFKQYLPVFAGVAHELDKVIQSRNVILRELKKTNQRKMELERQVQALKKKLDRVIQRTKVSSLVMQGCQREPKRIAGWNVQRSKEGYYRCYRKIQNRVHAIYIGKALDVNKAKKRIAEKERTLGLYNG